MVQIDIEFPNRCSDCELEIENLHNGVIWSHECPLVYKVYTDRFRDEEKHIDCPLREVPNGKWVWVSSTFDRTPCEMRFRCSNCHHETITHGQKPCGKFCPNCGADMRGET